MNTIHERLQVILHRIQHAQKPDRPVSLVAVSKTQPAGIIREAFNAGQHKFGENYLQEALQKQAQLTDLAIEWHFIGPIQSNKTQLIAQHFAWVHSVDRIKVAQRLNDARPPNLAPLQVCIQTNISSESTKSGAAVEDLVPLAEAISYLPNLQLRGLMAIPAPTSDIETQRAQFKAVKKAYEMLINHGFKLDTLSIGMSEDYLVAIEEGATIVRIGSKIFGARL
jgi:pyridoxal phosphate enzyme (YggS family)